MKADDINIQMDLLSDRLDHVKRGADAAIVSQLNADIADWQDFYWGNYDQWPVNEISRWTTKLADMRADMDGLESAAGVAKKVVKSKKKTAVVSGGPIAVTGTWPLWMKVAAGSAFALAFWMALKRLKVIK